MTLVLPRVATDPWERMPSATLTELEDRVPLLHRQDTKYLLDSSALESLLPVMAARHRLLEIDGRRAFRYDSVYVDDGALSVHQAHAQGRRLRYKARTRRYGDGPLCFQEVKLTASRGSTTKLRRACSSAEHGFVGPQFRAFLDEALQAHHGTVAPMDLRPSVTVRYTRRTLVLLDGGERVTVDQDLDFLDRTGRRCGAMRPDLALVEVKTSGGRGATDRAFWADGHRPVKMSKYGIGVSLSRPDLTPAPLRRLLRLAFEGPGDAAAGAALSRGSSSRC